VESGAEALRPLDAEDFDAVDRVLEITGDTGSPPAGAVTVEQYATRAEMSLTASRVRLEKAKKKGKLESDFFVIDGRRTKCYWPKENA
jgi:hypothetical protein